MYFHCQTTLVDSFRGLVPHQFKFEGNRCIVFDDSDRVPAAELKSVVAADLNYDELVILDAEALAETGLKSAYDPIYSKNDGDESWGRATFAIFDIVNRQLAKTPYRFFAINGGNDLGGMFLTPAQAEAAKTSLPRKQDCPYLPTASTHWYGRYH
jgi:hypothetical protein